MLNTFAKRTVEMKIEGMLSSIEVSKGGYVNKESGEVSKPNWKLVFTENIGTLDNVKLSITKIKISDIETEKEAEKLNKFLFKNISIKNIQFGQYKDSNGVYNDWFKAESKDIQEIK